jgi:hypothetical protein
LQRVPLRGDRYAKKNTVYNAGKENSHVR